MAVLAARSAVRLRSSRSAATLYRSGRSTIANLGTERTRTARGASGVGVVASGDAGLNYFIRKLTCYSYLCSVRSMHGAAYRLVQGAGPGAGLSRAPDHAPPGRGLHARRRALPERFPGARGLQLTHRLAALQLPPDGQGRLRPDQRRRAPGQDAAQRGLPARRLDRLQPPGGDGADGGGGGQEV